jgi:hypothetical protein
MSFAVVFESVNVSAKFQWRNEKWQTDVTFETWTPKPQKPQNPLVSPKGGFPPKTLFLPMYIVSSVPLLSFVISIGDIAQVTDTGKNRYGLSKNFKINM